ASGNCTVDRVAEHLACTRRTIHRRLAAYGTSFSAILDAQRADLVLQLIEDPSRPLAAIAQQLGFSAQSAMARWFRGRFGCSITEWRRGAREARTGWGDLSTREVSDAERPSPHPASHSAPLHAKRPSPSRGG